MSAILTAAHDLADGYQHQHANNMSDENNHESQISQHPNDGTSQWSY